MAQLGLSCQGRFTLSLREMLSMDRLRVTFRLRNSSVSLFRLPCLFEKLSGRDRGLILRTISLRSDFRKN